MEMTMDESNVDELRRLLAAARKECPSMANIIQGIEHHLERDPEVGAREVRRFLKFMEERDGR
jgi:hypothetical protein